MPCAIVLWCVLHVRSEAAGAVQPPKELPHGCAGDGKCVVCDSYVRPATLVRICDECNYGSYAGRCVICGGVGISDAYYCKECTVQEKDVSALASLPDKLRAACSAVSTMPWPAARYLCRPSPPLAHQRCMR
jgi:hypothetical protein